MSTEFLPYLLRKELHELPDLHGKYWDLRARRYEGVDPTNKGIGIWPVSVARVQKGLGFLTSNEWTYEGNDWPVKEPEGLDEKAKQNRLRAYTRMYGVKDIISVLGTRNSASFALEIFPSWNDPEGGGISLAVCDGEESCGTHQICCHGFDLSQQYFSFENSWGLDWGNYGHGSISFEYVDKHFVSGWHAELKLLSEAPWMVRGEGIQNISWGEFHPFRPGVLIHGREIYDSDRDKMLAWSFVIEAKEGLVIEEFYVVPDERGKGHGRSLMEGVREVMFERRKGVVAFVPFPDWNATNYAGLSRIMNWLGLVRHRESEVRWAAAKYEIGESDVIKRLRRKEKRDKHRVLGQAKVKRSHSRKKTR